MYAIFRDAVPEIVPPLTNREMRLRRNRSGQNQRLLHRRNRHTPGPLDRPHRRGR